MALPPNLPGEKPHVLVTHDESTLSANDGKRNLRIEKGKQPIRPKGEGRGVMVSDSITARGRLMVPWAISDELHELGLPRRYAIQYLEYSKGNYWTSDSMIDHAIQIALPILQTASPVFAFDNASTHFCFVSDALKVEKLNK